MFVILLFWKNFGENMFPLNSWIYGYTAHEMNISLTNTKNRMLKPLASGLRSAFIISNLKNV